MLQELHKHVNDSACITIQWDSAIIDGLFWTKEFEKFDYIGAPWPNNFSNRVGNGGFSYRTKKFLEATATLPYEKINHKELDAEDYHACVTCYTKMLIKGIEFAPTILARQFAVEHPIPEKPHKYNDLSTYQCFGFHSEYNKAGMDLIF